MKQIILGDNTYDVDTGDNESIRTALVSEIVFQHTKYGIVGRRNDPVEPRIHIRTRSTGVLQIQYSPAYSLYADNWKSVICFSESIEKSMGDVITKVVAKCVAKNESNDLKEQNEIEFRRYINAEFPLIDNEIDINSYSNNPSAKFETEGVQATLYQDGYVSIRVDKDKKATINVINKLFR